MPWLLYVLTKCYDIFEISTLLNMFKKALRYLHKSYYITDIHNRHAKHLKACSSFPSALH